MATHSNSAYVAQCERLARAARRAAAHRRHRRLLLTFGLPLGAWRRAAALPHEDAHPLDGLDEPFVLEHLDRLADGVPSDVVFLL